MSGEEIIMLPLPSSDVRAADLAAETQTVHRILDYLETAPSVDAAMNQPLDQYGRITAWVAKQLGCYAELQASRDQLPQALLTAYVSVNSALRCQDARRLLGNLLTVAGIYMRSRATDAAEQVYLHILELPIADAEAFLERASAHLSLATILVTGRPREAVEHYEQALCCLGARLPPEARSKVVRGMISAYRDLTDWVGLSYACKHLNLGDARTPLREALQSGLGLPQIVAADTRLRRLGAAELADQLYSIWSEMHTPGGSHE